jgi:copper chaperone CopZ
VTAVLNRLEGVDVERVSVGSAEVSFDPAKTSPSVIAEALTEAGYPARQEST